MDPESKVPRGTFRPGL